MLMAKYCMAPLRSNGLVSKDVDNHTKRLQCFFVRVGNIFRAKASTAYTLEKLRTMNRACTSTGE